MDETPDSVQDDLRATFTELSTQAEGQNNDKTPAHQPTTEAPSTGAATTGTDGATNLYTPRTPTQPLSADQQQAAKEPITQPTTPPPAPVDRAPVAWKPQLREKWSTLDPEVKAEVARREREIDTALRTTADSRRVADELAQTMQPYMGILNAENTTPIKAIDALMRTAVALRTSGPMQKAALVADMIQQYGIDVNVLDQHLAQRQRGQPGPQDPYAPIMQALDQRLAPMQQFMQQIQQTRQQTLQESQQQAQQSLEQFMADPANEFAQDVALDMADILDLAAGRGQKMTLQDAYNRATMLHPQIAEIVTQRKLTQQASQQTTAAQRARAASASVSNGGAPSQGPEDENVDDLRSAIQAAVRQKSR